MQIPSTIKMIVAVSIGFLILSCNNSQKNKVELQMIKQDQDTLTYQPPPPPPKSKVPIIPVEKKCFTNDGLKYKTVITMYVGDTSIVLGNVTSEETGSGKKETTEFIGSLQDHKLTVNFKNNPPVIGDGSEWTDKPWTLKKTATKETLQIIFNAKNYDNNKWEDVKYEFELSDCK